MDITLRRDDGEPRNITFYQAFKLLPAHVDPVPILRRLGLGETVTVRLNDDSWATLTLNSVRGQPQLDLAHQPIFNACCTLLVPLKADVRCQAADKTAVAEQIHAVLRSERRPARHFQVIVNTEHLDEIWYGIDHDSGTLKVPFRYVAIDSIDEIKLLRGP